MTERLTTEQLAKKMYEGTDGVIPGAVVKHIKSGDKYMVLAVCLREEDLEPMVVYCPIDDEKALAYSIAFCRPAAEFMQKFTTSDL